MAEKEKAESTLPQGDPAIEAIKSQLAALKPEWLAAKEKAQKIYAKLQEASKAYDVQLEAKDKADAAAKAAGKPA